MNSDSSNKGGGSKAVVTEPVSIEEIKKYLKLALLDAEREDLEALTREVNSILETVRALFAVPVDGVEPMTHVMANNGEGADFGRILEGSALEGGEDADSVFPLMRSSGVFRDDKQGEHLPTSRALANAPDRSGNFFRVPLVIED